MLEGALISVLVRHHLLFYLVAQILVQALPDFMLLGGGSAVEFQQQFRGPGSDYRVGHLSLQVVVGHHAPYGGAHDAGR